MAENLLLKFAIACAVLAFAVAAGVAPAVAQPRNAECVDCPVSNKYDSEEIVEKIRNLKKSMANEAPIDVRADQRAYEPKRVPDNRRAPGSRNTDCADCEPRRKYDSQEVVKKVRNVDHSRVINTKTVVPVRPRVRETNHLVIHNNETRNVGVIQHNRIVVEKEIRYVRRIPLRTTVEFVTHDYRVVERPASITVPVCPGYIGNCSRSMGRYGSCGPLRVRG